MDHWGQNSGHSQCTSHLLLVSFTPSSHTCLGGSGGHPSLWYWGGRCIYCYGRVQGMQGVFCANLGYSQRGWNPCKECWHGDWLSDNPDREPYYYGVMEDAEVIPCSCNPKDELRYKHLTNVVHMWNYLPWSYMSLLQYQIQAPYKLSKGQGVHDAHQKVYYGLRLGEVTLHN